MQQNGFRAVGALALALVAGCGGEPSSQRTPPPDAKRVDVSKVGQIAGRVILEGTAPQNAPIDVAGDPVCIRENKEGLSAETFSVENGGLNNVFVYVKDGLGNYYFDTPAEAVKLDQKACHYTPRVFGVQTGQPIEISNSDPTMHNVHAVANLNRDFNFPQALQGLKTTKTFTAPEIMVRFKCDVHGWMVAYAGVLDHPYFAVTGNGGRFELKNVPAGSYTIEAWHEKLGTQTASVILGEKESQQVSVTFKPATSNE